MYVDPWGLFDYNTRLSQSIQENDDVRVLQAELKKRGYYTDKIDGKYGPNTLNAVNQYKKDQKLGNTGKDAGVVGLQTWSSLGLIYRTADDINAGVRIITINLEQYFDVSTPINKLLVEAASESVGFGHKFNPIWFYGKVNHNEEWDIKRENPWTQTLKITYPGSSGAYVVFENEFVTPEELGNLLYGYAGTATGFSENMLITGSIFASGIWRGEHSYDEYVNEYTDHILIRKGIRRYEQKK